MTESQLYQNHLKKFFKKKGIYSFRVEHERLPDLYLSRSSKSLWAELKCVNRRSKIVEPDWRPGQLSWIKENELYGNSYNICLILWYVGSIYFLHPQRQYTEEDLQCQKDHYLKMYL